jgi:hypothetical protein
VILQCIQVRPNLLDGNPMELGKERVQIENGRLWIEARDVELRSIAGRNDHGFRSGLAADDGAHGVFEPAAAEIEPLA